MTFYFFNGVLYIRSRWHDATIRYSSWEGEPIAWVTFDDEEAAYAEGFQARNGMTMKVAYHYAVQELRWRDYNDYN